MASQKTTHSSIGKRVGKAVMFSTSEILKSIMPNMSSTVESARQSVTDVKSYIRTSAPSMKTEFNVFANGQLGKQTQDIYKMALNDINSGTFSLDKITGEVSGLLRRPEESPAQNASDNQTTEKSSDTFEQKDNTASVVSSTASIQSMKIATDTVSKAQLNAAQIVNKNNTTLGLLSMNAINSGFSGVNSRLDTINKNLVSMINFSNQNISVVNQATLKWYDMTTDTLNRLDNKLSSIDKMADVLEKLEKSFTIKKEYSYKVNRNSFANGGLDFSEYGKYIKKNASNSMFGALFGTLQTLSQTSKLTGDATLMPKIMLSQLLPMLIPKKIKKPAQMLDKHFGAYVKNLLYQVGDWENDFSGSMLKQIIGSIFGLKRGKLKSNVFGEYKKDAMMWNGIAQKTLVEVIPDQLSQIISLLGKKEREVYDYQSGTFMNQKDIAKKYREDTQFQTQMSFYKSVEDIQKSLGKNTNLTEKQLKDIQDTLSGLVTKRVQGKMGYDDQYRQELTKTLKNVVSKDDFKNIALNIEDGIEDLIKNLNEQRLNIANNPEMAAYRSLFNHMNQNVEDLNQKIDLFTSESKYINWAKYGKGTDAEVALRKHQAEMKKAEEKKWKGKVSKATSRFKQHAPHVSTDYYDKMINNMDNFAFKHVMKMSQNDIDKSMKDATHLIASEERRSNRRYQNTGSTAADLENKKRLTSSTTSNAQSYASDNNGPRRATSRATNESEATVEATTAVQGAAVNAFKEQTRSLKDLIFGEFGAFFKPLTGGLFGKDGLIKKLFAYDTLKATFKDIGKKLFDEKDGVFKDVTKHFYDIGDYIKYVFTGKGYSNRYGKKYPDTKNSVGHFLKNSYQFLFTNTMKYFFGKEFERNSTYQKYFSWMNLDKHNPKDEQLKNKKTSNINMNANKAKEQSRGTNKQRSLEASNTKLLTDHHEHISSKQQKADINNGILYLPAVAGEQVSTALATTTKGEIKKTTSKITSQISTDATKASADVVKDIVKSGKDMSMTIFGDEKGTADQTQKKSSWWQKFKNYLPRSIAAGIIGAGLTGLTGGHLGLIGGLFLPSGPFGGAIVGIGLSLLSKTDTFQRIMFGDKDDKTGERTGGLISTSMRKAFKKSLPLMVGGGVLGALKKTIFGTGLIGKTPFGLLMNAFLPGGVVGGALMGMATALLFRNEKLNKILFGEKDADNKRAGGIFSNSINKFNSSFAKSMKFVKGGVKGLGIGLISNTIISKMGVLGAMATMGGPIGAAVAGLSVGIASQSKRFQTLLFGSEKLDANGNPTGQRNRDGLISRFVNTINVRVIDPIAKSAHDTFTNLGYWMKEKIMYPFKLAFGPVVSSLQTLKDSISDFVKEKFEDLSKGIGSMFKTLFKKLFSPITSIIGKIGSVVMKGIGASIRATLFPIEALANIGAALTSPQRAKAKVGFYKDYFQANKMNAKSKWEQGKNNGPLGKLSAMFGIAKDYAGLFDSDRLYKAKSTYAQAMKANGENSMDWFFAEDENRITKQKAKAEKENQHQWDKIDRLRLKYFKEDEGKEVPWTRSKTERRKKEFESLGIKNGIDSEEDIKDLIYRKRDWRSKNDTFEKDLDEKYGGHSFMGKPNGIGGLGESPEQTKARTQTADYQNLVGGKVSGIYEILWNLASQRAEQKHRFRTAKGQARARARVYKNMKKGGLNPDDFNFNIYGDKYDGSTGSGYDINDKDFQDLTDFEWDEYRSSPFAETGDFKGWFAQYKKNNAEDFPSNVKESTMSDYIKSDFFKRGGYRGFQSWWNWWKKKNSPIITPPPKSEKKKDEDTTNTKSEGYGSGSNTNSAVVYSINNSLEKTNENQTKQTNFTSKIMSTIEAIKNHIVNDNSNSVVVDRLDSMNEALYGKFFYDRSKRSTRGILGSKMSDEAVNSAHVTPQTIATANTKAQSGLFASLFEKRRKQQQEDAAKAEEEKETEQADALGNKKIQLGTVSSTGSTSTEAGKTKSPSIFSRILNGVLGFGSNIFGSIGNILGNTGLWGKLGIAAGLAVLFRKPIEKYLPGIVNSVAGFISTNIPKVLEKGTAFVVKWGPQVINTVSDVFKVLAPSIIKGTWSIMSSYVTSVSDILKNGLGIANPTKSLTESEAKMYQEQGYNVYQDSNGNYYMPNSRTYKDSNGNYQTVADTDAMYHLGRSVLNSTTSKKAAEATGSVLGGAFGFKPGAEVGKRAGGAVYDASNGAVTWANNRFAAKKAAKEAAKNSAQIITDENGNVVGKIVNDAGNAAENKAQTSIFSKLKDKFTKKTAAETATASINTPRNAAAVISENAPTTIGNTSRIATDEVGGVMIDGQGNIFNATPKYASAITNNATNVVQNTTATLSDASLKAKAINTGGAEDVKSITNQVEAAASELTKNANNDAVTSVLGEGAESTSAFKKIITSINNKCQEAVKSMSKNHAAIAKLNSRLGDIAAGSIKVIAGFARAATIVLPIYDAVSGAYEAENLFEVSSDAITPTMRVISALFKVLCGFSVFAIIDVVIDVVSDVFGINFKQTLASVAYDAYETAFGGANAQQEIQNLSNAQNNLAVATWKYNKANGTNMSTSAFSSKLNPSFWKKIKAKVSSFFTGGSGDATSDLSKYTNITDADIAEYNQVKNKTAATSTDSASDTSNTGTTSPSDIAKFTKTTTNASGQNYYKGMASLPSSVSSKAIYGYGQGPYDDKLKNIGIDRAAIPKSANTAALGFTNTYNQNEQSQEAVGYGPGTSKTFAQNDSRWANYRIGTMPNGKPSTMSNGGCGPTALSTVASSLKSKSITPVSVAKFAKNNGYIAEGGSTASLFTKGARQMGLRSSSVTKNSVAKQLSSGKPVILSGRSAGNGGPYTKAGHIISAKGLDSRGNTTVSDPQVGVTQKMNVKSLTNGMTHGWAYSSNGSTGYGQGFEDSINNPYPVGYGLWDWVSNAAKTIGNAAKSVGNFAKWLVTPQPQNLQKSNKYIMDHVGNDLISKVKAPFELAKYGIISVQQIMTEPGLVKKVPINDDITRYIAQCPYSPYFPWYKYFIQNLTGPQVLDLYENSRKLKLTSWNDILYATMKNRVEEIANMGYSIPQDVIDNYNNVMNGKNVNTKSAGSLVTNYVSKSSVVKTYLSYKANLNNPNNKRAKNLLAADPALYGLSATETKTEYLARSLRDKNKSVAALIAADIRNSIRSSSKAEYAVLQKVRSNPSSYLNNYLFCDTLNRRTLALIKNVMSTTSAFKSVNHTAFDHAYNDKFGVNNYNLPSVKKDLAAYIKKEFPNNSNNGNTPNEDDEKALEALLPTGAVGKNGLFSRYGTIYYSQLYKDWKDLPWGNSTIGNNGGDLVSTAMAMSTFSGRGLTPDYILQNWFRKYPEWVSNGQVSNLAFKDGEINAEKEAIGTDNQRIKIKPLQGSKDIINELKLKHPVMMTGYQYNGSIFGGNTPISDLRTGSKKHSVLATAATDKLFAVNDPLVDPSKQWTFFKNSELDDKPGNGKAGSHPYTRAYSFQLGKGSGSGSTGWDDLSTDLDNWEVQTTGYKTAADMGDSIWGELAATFTNFRNVIDNQIKSVFTRTPYVSIFKKAFRNSATGTVENTGLDDAAVAARNANGGKSPNNNNITYGDGSTDIYGSASADSRNGDYLHNTSNIIPYYGNYKASKILDNSLADRYADPFLKRSKYMDKFHATKNTNDGYSNQSGVEAQNGDHLGVVAARFESSGSPSTISSGSGDHGGVSFGTYQLASYGDQYVPSNSQLARFWNQYYGNKHSGVRPGDNSSFKQAWLEEAKSDPSGFQANEQSFMAKNYYKPMTDKISGILNPDTHSRAAQESAFSTVLQYGSGGGPSVFKGALNNENAQAMSPANLINKIQDYKTATIDDWFSGSSSSVRNGVRNRHNITERAALLALGNQPPLKISYGGGPIGYGSGPVGYGTSSSDLYSYLKDNTTSVTNDSRYKNVASNISAMKNIIDRQIKSASTGVPYATLKAQDEAAAKNPSSSSTSSSYSGSNSSSHASVPASTESYIQEDASNISLNNPSNWWSRILTKNTENTLVTSSPFNEWRKGTNGKWTQHKGIDYARSGIAGTPIVSPAAGYIDYAGWENNNDHTQGYGQYVKLHDKRGYFHYFGHMSNIGNNIKTGSTVDRGTILGYVGTTGDSTGPHLHYEIRQTSSKNSAIDPNSFTYTVPSYYGIGYGIGDGTGLNKSAFPTSTPTTFDDTDPFDISSQAFKHSESSYKSKDNYYGIGDDISSAKKVEITHKIQNAISTTGIENKMDAMLSVLKDIFTADNKIANTTINQTTTNVAYGSGQSSGSSKPIVVSTSNSSNPNIGNDLRQIHELIARL